MARQLSQRGKEIGILALFDTGTPEYKKSRSQNNSKIIIKTHQLIERSQMHKANISDLTVAEKLNYVLQKVSKGFSAHKRRIQNTRKKIVRAVYSKFKGKGAIPKDYIQLEDQLMRAQRKFEPKPYSGKVTLFRASIQPYGLAPNPTLGWESLVDDIDVYEVTGHHTSIVAEPYVRGLASLLTDHLDKARHDVAIEQRDEVVTI